MFGSPSFPVIWRRSRAEAFCVYFTKQLGPQPHDICWPLNTSKWPPDALPTALTNIIPVCFIKSDCVTSIQHQQPHHDGLTNSEYVPDRREAEHDVKVALNPRNKEL